MQRYNSEHRPSDHGQWVKWEDVATEQSGSYSRGELKQLAELPDASIAAAFRDIAARNYSGSSANLFRAHLIEKARAAVPTTWDASQIKQPGWHHVAAAFVEGAREARNNPEVGEEAFDRAADGYTKRVFEEVDPVSEEALRTENWRAPVASTPTTSELLEAANAVVDRWDTPNWKDAPHTGEFIHRLREAIAKTEGAPVANTEGEKADLLVVADTLEKSAEVRGTVHNQADWQRINQRKAAAILRRFAAVPSQPQQAAAGDKALNILRAAMVDAEIDHEDRANLIGYFCNRWNAATGEKP